MNKLFNGRLFCLLLVFAVSGIASNASAQDFGNQFVVNDTVDTIEVIAGTSRVLTFDYKIPELWVENPEVVKASPVAPNEISVTGLEPGISALTVSDPSGNRQQISVQVVVDVRKLERALSEHFSESSISVHALETGVLLKGYVSRQSHVEAVMAVARDYFPTQVVNRLQVNQPQQVAIKVKIYEVSRTKLRQLGVDWAYFGSGGERIVSSVADVISAVGTGSVSASGQTMTLGVLNSGDSFDVFINALERNNVAKLLDEPTIVTTHGRPAEFLSGGEIPIAIAAGLGTTSIEFRAFGTKLDIVPLILGGGEMRLEVRAEVSEVANDLSNNTGVPGFRVRRVNTGVQMRAGHTLALAGDFRQETESEIKGLPHLMDSPFAGPFFRKSQEQQNESELIFMITPRFITDVDPGRVPNSGPGQLTSSPSDHELYVNGYSEVPRCTDDCPINDRFDDPTARPAQMGGALGQTINRAMPGGQYTQQGQGQEGQQRQAPYQPASTGANNGGGFGYPQQEQSGSGFAWPAGSGQ